MKRILLLALFSCHLNFLYAQQPFKFAFLSDTHISTDPGVPADDLRRTIADLNLQTYLDFIVITGDITECDREK